MDQFVISYKLVMAIIAISESRFEEAVENNEGFCTNCQEFTADQCEPDACEYKCPECGLSKVYGAEEALMMGAIEFSEGEGDDE